MFQVIELSAAVAGAIYVVLLALRHRMDFVGAVIIASVVAFGGGTLRDVFLDRHPLFWTREDRYPAIVFTIALIASLVPKVPLLKERWLLISDAPGLGLFGLVWANASLEAVTSLFVATLMGVITEMFGGGVCDVVCNQVPSRFGHRPALCNMQLCRLLAVV